jgi:diguanylate cyclase (GGDEF)-like protein
VNRAHGYERGDLMLTAFGSLLLTYTRARDLPARTSGARFAAILPDTTKRGAYAMVERLIQATNEATFLSDVSNLPFEVAFGVAGYPWSGDSRDAIVSQSETELQQGGIILSDDRPAIDSDIPAAFRNIDEPLTDPEVSGG